MVPLYQPSEESKNNLDFGCGPMDERKPFVELLKLVRARGVSEISDENFGNVVRAMAYGMLRNEAAGVG